MTEHPGLTFVTALYRCRELGAALERFASAGTLYNVRRSLAQQVREGSARAAVLTARRGACLVPCGPLQLRRVPPPIGGVKTFKLA